MVELLNMKADSGSRYTIQTDGHLCVPLLRMLHYLCTGVALLAASVTVCIGISVNVIM